MTAVIGKNGVGKSTLFNEQNDKNSQTKNYSRPQGSQSGIRYCLAFSVWFPSAECFPDGDRVKRYKSKIENWYTI
jgi:hypothetical protein